MSFVNTCAAIETARHDQVEYEWKARAILQEFSGPSSPTQHDQHWKDQVVQDPVLEVVRLASSVALSEVKGPYSFKKSSV